MSKFNKNLFSCEKIQTFISPSSPIHKMYILELYNSIL